ncbi:Protein K08D10.5, partial [Aphelenchoides avenae]
MHQCLFEVRPQVTPLVPRGITKRFREGELSRTIASDGVLEDGTVSKRLEEKVETLKAFLGGGCYQYDKPPTDRQIQLVQESDFNTQQKNAVLAFFDGHRQGIVLAGAGTGKTAVISGAVQVMCDSANAQEDQLVQDCNRIVRQNFGVEEYNPETWLHEPRLPEVKPWLIAAPSNAAVGNGIQACVKRCGKQFKFITLMGATALKKIYGGTTPWQKHLAPAMINDMAAEGERWGLSKHEYELFARAINICSKRYSCLSGVNWTQLVNEKETDEDDNTVMRLVLQAVIRRYRPQVIFGTVSTVIRSMDAMKPFIDLVCLDEASTCPEIATLAVLLTAEAPRKTMLVGDNAQLGPHEANLHSRNKKIGFRSVLDAVLGRKYLEGEGNMKIVQLTESHRFEKQVGEFVSRAFYDGKMTTSTNNGGHRKLVQSSFPLPRKGVPMVAVDIGGEETRNVVMSFSVQAHTEAVVNLVTAIKLFVPTASIGVVCFYNGQIDALLDAGIPIPKHDVHSVDSSQGLEYDIVIIVPARADVNEERDTEFLGSKKRQCVSFSRGRCGFFLVGALRQLYKVDSWKEVLDILYQFTDQVGPEYMDAVNGMVEVELENRAAAQSIAPPTYAANEDAEDEVQIIDDESADVRRVREAFNIPDNDPHFSPSMARGIDVENLDRHSDSPDQSQGDADMDAIEQLEPVSTPPGLFGEPQQPQQSDSQNTEAMDLSTS